MPETPASTKVPLTYLPRNQFRSIIRLIRRAPVDRVEVLLSSSRDELRRLKTKPDPSKAISGVPRGSDQFNVGTIITWMRNIKRGDKKPIGQVVAINATAEARLTGK